MFSDNQRRFICRMLFLLACVAPTVVIGYYICHPQTVTFWQREIQAQLGIAATIDSIETPGPYVTILRGVKFSDSELGTILDAMEVKIEFGERNVVTVPQKIRLTNAGLIHLTKTLNEHLLRAHAADRPWQIFLLEQTIIQESIHAESLSGQFPQTLVTENLQIAIDPLIDGTLTVMHFQLPNMKPDQWVSASLARSHADSTRPSQQRLELNTNQQLLPCWLLGDLIPEISNLGPQCQFAGRINLYPQNGKPYGGFEGKFVGIDGSAISPGFDPNNPAHFSAEVRLCSLEGGIKHLDASLIHPDGSTAQIQNTLAVVEQFDLRQSLRTAAQSNQFQHADSTLLR